MSVTASAAGESASFADRLYVAHSAALLRYCRRRLGCPIEAEDAVQTTFLYATRALQRGVVPESESAWLHAIAKNVCRWQRRTEARRPSVASDPHAGPVTDEPAHDTDHGLAFEIREALARVPERQRQALVLCEVQGLPANEVATVLGLRLTDTYALLSRARRSFARAFELVSGRTSLGAQVGPLLLKLKGALFGGTATIVAATSIAGVVVGLGGAGAGGVASERRAPPAADVRASSVADAVTGGARDDAVRAGDASRGAASRAEARGRRTARPAVVLPPDGIGEAETTGPPGPTETRDETPPAGAGPTADAPAPVPEQTPEPAPALPLSLRGVPLPIEEPDLGLELPLDPPPLPLPDTGDLLEPITSDAHVLGEPLPEVAVPGVPAPKLP